jgi:hypothetical protein
MVVSEVIGVQYGFTHCDIDVIGKVTPWALTEAQNKKTAKSFFMVFPHFGL